MRYGRLRRAPTAAGGYNITMERIPEPELMDEEEQACAYAAADFSEPHGRFIELFRESFPGLDPHGHVLDLGCGPGDIAMRFARAFPGCRVQGIDGAVAMLRCGLAILAGDDAADVRGRVELIQARLPVESLPRPGYDIVISNSLLHHLSEPSILWKTVEAAAAPGAPVFIMDLMRPAAEAEARRLVDVYMPVEPEILKRDFFNSLLAAFTVDEVRAQLVESGLEYLKAGPVSDRHLAVWGRFQGNG